MHSENPTAIPGSTVAPSPFPEDPNGLAALSATAPGKFKVIRRNGVVRVICSDPRHKQRQG